MIDLILGSRVPRLKCCCRGRKKSGLSGPQPSSPQLCLGEGPASCFSLFHIQDGPHLCQDGEDAHLRLLLGVGQADGCVSRLDCLCWTAWGCPRCKYKSAGSRPPFNALGQAPKTKNQPRPKGGLLEWRKEAGCVPSYIGAAVSYGGSLAVFAAVWLKECVYCRVGI